MQTVRRLCRRAIWLEAGRVVADGDAEAVVGRYLESVDTADVGRRHWAPDERPGDDLCRVVEVRVTDDTGETGASFFNSRPIHVTTEFELASVNPSFSLGFDVVTLDGVLVFHSLHRDVPDDAVPRLVPGRNALRATIPPGLLNAGRYLLNVRVSLHNARWIAWEDGVLHFDVIADHGESLFFSSQNRPGIIAPVLDWAAVEPFGDEAVAEPDASRVLQ